MGKEDRLKKVFICSPCRPRGETPKARERDWIGNINRARQACRYAIDEGKIPYAPHLYFTTILSEADEDERELGILLGLVWLSQCDELWIIGRRITEGMKREIAQAEAWNIKVVIRTFLKNGSLNSHHFKQEAKNVRITKVCG